ncbi:sialidase [Aplysia californica]|uniref:Sialidase n=1 Tax=Aplysia californica TaxID=6500 RepID=A0ABM0K222_APLCA|nr:sialidase [Aplysia californica]
MQPSDPACSILERRNSPHNSQGCEESHRLYGQLSETNKSCFTHPSSVPGVYSSTTAPIIACVQSSSLDFLQRHHNSRISVKEEIPVSESPVPQRCPPPSLSSSNTWKTPDTNITSPSSSAPHPPGPHKPARAKMSFSISSLIGNEEKDTEAVDTSENFVNQINKCQDNHKCEVKQFLPRQSDMDQYSNSKTPEPKVKSSENLSVSTSFSNRILKACSQVDHLSSLPQPRESSYSEDSLSTQNSIRGDSHQAESKSSKCASLEINSSYHRYKVETSSSVSRVQESQNTAPVVRSPSDETNDSSNYTSDTPPQPSAFSEISPRPECHQNLSTNIAPPPDVQKDPSALPSIPGTQENHFPSYRPYFQEMNGSLSKPLVSPAVKDYDLRLPVPPSPLSVTDHPMTHRYVLPGHLWQRLPVRASLYQPFPMRFEARDPQFNVHNPLLTPLHASTETPQKIFLSSNIRPHYQSPAYVGHGPDTLPAVVGVSTGQHTVSQSEDTSPRSDTTNGSLPSSSSSSASSGLLSPTSPAPSSAHSDILSPVKAGHADVTALSSHVISQPGHAPGHPDQCPSLSRTSLDGLRWNVGRPGKDESQEGKSFKTFLENANVRIEFINSGNGIKNPLLSTEFTDNKLGLVSGNRSLPCPVCQLTFDSPKHLQRHFKSHKEIKRFLCTFCGKGFNDTFDLKRHTRTHTGVRPYRCSHCDKAFTQRCSLESHCRKIHGLAEELAFNERRVKLYVCEDCGHSTDLADEHYAHVRHAHSQRHAPLKRNVNIEVAST